MKGLTVATVQKKAKNRMLAVNDKGRRIGDSHPRAVLSNTEVDLLLELRGEGYSYGWLAGKFEIHKGTVAKICSGQRRCQLPDRFKPVGLFAFDWPRRARGR